MSEVFLPFIREHLAVVSWVMVAGFCVFQVSVFGWIFLSVWKEWMVVRMKYLDWKDQRAEKKAHRGRVEAWPRDSA